MNKDRFDVLERFAPLFHAPEPSFETFLRRRDRKRRNQRIAAGVVGIALFLVPVAVVAGRTLFDRAQAPRPAAPGQSPRVVAPRLVPNVDYTIDLKTGDMTRLPGPIIRSLGPTGQHSHYAASKDGSMIAFVGTAADESRQIFIARIDGTGIRQVTQDPDNATEPAWSPDGTKIAYLGYGGGNVRNLFVLDVATGQTTQLTDGGEDLYEPQFTPDGSSILYTGGTGRAPVLRTVPVAGGQSKIFIGPPRGPILKGDLDDAGNGSISPDGSLVTFLGSENGRPGPQRWVVNLRLGSSFVDGRGRTPIPGWISNSAGTWSPDGTRIVCSEFSNDGTNLYIVVVDINSRKATRVAEGGAAIWLDDHTLLVDRFTLP
jgi:Tol biopolymer transport system component